MTFYNSGEDFSSFISYVCCTVAMCVCLFARVEHMCVKMSMNMSVCGGPRLSAGVSLDCSFTSFFEAGSSSQTQCLGQGSPGSTF